MDVRLKPVVAGHDPDLAAMFDANLRRSENVSGGMERETHAVDGSGFPIVDSLDRSVRPEPNAQRPFPLARCEVPFAPSPRMIGVGVGDHRPRNGIPRIDIEIACLAIKAGVAQSDEVRHETRDKFQRRTADPAAGSCGAALYWQKMEVGPELMLRHTWIDRTLLEHVSGLAAASPRRRKNFNFHLSEHEASHRLLNAIEPDSYIPPHRHLDSTKDETLIVVRGQLGAVIFDEAGKVADTAVLDAGGERVGINVIHGTYHTVLALAPGTVFFESKAGPFRPLGTPEFAPWAPREGAEDAQAYFATLRKLFD